MNIEVMALVIRDKRDNRIIDITPIGDMYDTVSVEYDSDYVSPKEIRKFVESWMGKDHQKAIDAENDLENNGIWVDQQEAKDFSSVGNMIIGIETKKIDWN